MGFFRKFAIKQVAGDHIYGISKVIAQCKRDMSQVPKRQWAKAIVEARYDEPGEREVRESLIEQIERHEINDAIIQPNLKRDWQQYILDEYGKYGISINEATEHWG